MRFIVFLYFFLHTITVSLAQDYVEPLRYNADLFGKNNFTPVTLSGSNTFDSTFIYLADTLSLPFFDEFSSDKFQTYERDFDNPTLVSELFYKLLDELDNTPLPDDAVYTDERTYRMEVNLELDTIILHYFDSTRFQFSPLSSYPVDYQVTFGYPPYFVIDTIGTETFVKDTIWLDDAIFHQDSARIFIQQLNDPDKLWLNRQAYHNYRFAKKPWSLGVVTFDGLDENGFPYIFAPTNITMTCDTLFSKPINMTTAEPQDSVYFSFLYQTEGYGDVPEEGDSLYLDFYDVVDARWRRVWAAGGEPVSDFKVAHIPVTNPNYFQNGFQFRFMNYGSPAGALDHFHVDYVHLRPFSGYQDTLFKDYAFVYPITTLLKDYTSVPWKHYRNNPENKMSDSVKITVRNGSELPENNQNGNVAIFFDEQLEGSFTLNASTLSGGNINYAPRTAYVSYHDFSQGYAFDENLSNDTMASFNWIANASAQFPNYTPNDSTFGEQVFKNYYAYDDGSAEKAYGVFGIQSQLAYQFNAYQPDSLIAVQIHFVPSVNDISDNLFLLAVWDDNNGRPGTKIYEDEFFFPKLPKYRNERNEFHTYFFKDTMKVPVGERFYIGWRQIEEERLNVGFDMNNDNSDKIFWSVDGGNVWNNANFPGSLLMRPIVTSKLDYTLGVKESVKKMNDKVEFTVYPNPASHEVRFKLSNNELADIILMDLNGKVLKTNSSDVQMNVQDLSSGIYIVRAVQNGLSVGTQKLVVR